MFEHGEDEILPKLGQLCHILRCYIRISLLNPNKSARIGVILMKCEAGGLTVKLNNSLTLLHEVRKNIFMDDD